MNQYVVKTNMVEWLHLPIGHVLQTTHIPPFQRIENQEHVDVIYGGLEKYYTEHKTIFLPSVISLAKYDEDGDEKNEKNEKNEKYEKQTVLDGQHRLAALKRLSDKYTEIKNMLIRTDIYHVLNDKEAYEIYQIINTSRKVELYDGDISPFVIPRLQTFMRNTFREYCKESKNPRGVNINLDEMAKHFQGYDVVKKLGITLENIETTLFERILALNKFYQKQKPETFTAWGVDDFKEKYQKYLEGNDNPFYLGLYKKFEWIEHLIDTDTYAKRFQDVEHNSSETTVKKRQKIPLLTRQKVWEKRCGNLLIGECYVCSHKIKYDQYHCGHIISVKDGGTNSVDNLEPICAGCNLDMGSMNLHVYKKLFVT
jgi:hypothetical protein